MAASAKSVSGELEEKREIELVLNGANSQSESSASSSAISEPNSRSTGQPILFQAKVATASAAISPDQPRLNPLHQLDMDAFFMKQFKSFPSEYQKRQFFSDRIAKKREKGSLIKMLIWTEGRPTHERNIHDDKNMSTIVVFGNLPSCYSDDLKSIVLPGEGLNKDVNNGNEYGGNIVLWSSMFSKYNSSPWGINLYSGYEDVPCREVFNEANKMMNGKHFYHTVYSTYDIYGHGDMLTFLNVWQICCTFRYVAGLLCNAYRDKPRGGMVADKLLGMRTYIMNTCCSSFEDEFDRATYNEEVKIDQEEKNEKKRVAERNALTTQIWDAFGYNIELIPRVTRIAYRGTYIYTVGNERLGIKTRYDTFYIAKSDELNNLKCYVLSTLDSNLHLENSLNPESGIITLQDFPERYRSLWTSICEEQVLNLERIVPLLPHILEIALRKRIINGFGGSKCYEMGNLFWHGKNGFVKDEVAAIIMWKRGAIKGDIKCKIELVKRYLDDSKLEQDKKIVLALCEEIIASGKMEFEPTVKQLRKELGIKDENHGSGCQCFSDSNIGLEHKKAALVLYEEIIASGKMEFEPTAKQLRKELGIKDENYRSGCQCRIM